MYELIHHPSSIDLYAVKLTEGNYKGVVVRYNVVDLKDDGVLKFDYTVIESADHEQSVLQDDEDFKTTLGDTLMLLIDESINYKDKKGMELT